ncbi:hypothetical protein Z517_10218 [Fonsecaea pedrosoi CBS 271.37]|uniref:Aminoglycoside phosphotransferase domain-containing protein n=1 Tax=Fonsecaea pedrosoi CBS 271.37 TaxID=1442368 RepID=A0A0D2EM66_9EURO|nr:uncharacterized protein Z517_10218 [Fonsecaea pedrosoi CBS 271.37]KIW75477.1 hypothetical protein Z517_10218 [Fonsecaea pedrosoi CBS 271.37]
MNLLPPDPLAFTGPFPLADLAPQYMTREQIESVVAHAPKLFQTGGDLPNDGDIPAKAVARVSNGAVVKYGTRISLGDRQANESVYIVMQYVPGKTLAHTIEDLDEEQIRDLANQLIRILTTLHTVHHTVPGPVGGGRVMAPRLFTTSGVGPFYSLQDLIDWFNKCLKICHSFGRFFGYIYLKSYAEFMPIGMKSAAGMKFLQAVVDAIETLETRRMNAKFNAIGYVCSQKMTCTI